MSKKKRKELLKVLSGEMKGMMRDSKKDLFGDMKPEKGMKVTMMSDSKEGIIDAAKELPKILSKSEQIMKAKLGSKDSKCSACDSSPCECEGSEE